MSSEIEVYEAGDEQYEELAKMVEEGQKTRVFYDYDTLAHAYNNAEIGAVVLIPAEATTHRGNLAVVLEGRGLVEGNDFAVSKPLRSPQGSIIPTNHRRLLVRKVSNKDMRIVNK